MFSSCDETVPVLHVYIYMYRWPRGELNSLRPGLCTDLSDIEFTLSDTIVITNEIWTRSRPTCMDMYKVLLKQSYVKSEDS